MHLICPAHSPADVKSLDSLAAQPDLLQSEAIQRLLRKFSDLSSSTPPAPPAPAAAAAEAPRPVPTGTTPGTERGCYLIAEEGSSGGTLYTIWSETKLEGALAFCEPNKTVPKFKFTSKGGKSELVRGIRGPLVKNYYNGFLEFVKITRDCDGILYISPSTQDISLHVNKDNLVSRLETGLPIRFDGPQAVAAGPFSTLTFNVGSMAVSMFLNKGSNEGAAITLR